MRAESLAQSQAAVAIELPIIHDGMRRPDFHFDTLEIAVEGTIAFRSSNTLGVGQGGTLVVLHGGPGFSYEYLVAPLACLSNQFTRIYSEPLKSSTAGEVPTYEAACRRTAELLSTKAEHGFVRVFAHSWGALLLLGALPYCPKLAVSGVLVAPVPTTWAKFQGVSAKLIGSLSEAGRALIFDPSIGVLSDEQIQGLLPFYQSPKATDSVRNLRFDMNIYRDVVPTMAGYDVRSTISRLHDFTIFTGEDDFILRDDISDLISVAREVVTIPNAGHFPFSEQPDAFANLLTELAFRSE